MKYINFKRYKFSRVFKNINFSRYIFLKFFKLINFVRFDFKKAYKYLDVRRINFTRFDFKKTYKYLDVRRINFTRFNFKKAYKYLDVRRINFTGFANSLNLKKYSINHIKKIFTIRSKFLLIHLPATIIFFGFLYIFIPTFFSYDKSEIQNLICKNKKIKCVIKGKVSYNFYPTPRIKIKDLVINDLVNKKNTLITIENAIVKLSIKNLLTKDKHKFKEIGLNNYKINLDLKKFKKYQNIFVKSINYIPVRLSKGQIIFFDGDDYVATINDVDLDLKIEQDFMEGILKGKFLNDDIKISLDSEIIDGEKLINIILKMSNLNLLTKIELFNFKKDKNIVNSNILIKKNSNKLTAIFEYKDNKLNIKKSNLRNPFIDGKLNGEINFSPYFDYNLDLSLNSMNFTKLYNYFSALNKKEQIQLFTINNKLNGMLNFSADKLYTKHNLVKSFESRIKFFNGNISIEQFLLNLGKLGAADILGTINKDKKFTNFNFESNIFVDNEKKFISKFGIYNKKNIPSNLFISGNFDLENITLSFYEISNNKKFNNADVNYIEKEFNNLMLDDGYTNLFHFSKFKEFIKLTTSENN